MIFLLQTFLFVLLQCNGAHGNDISIDFNKRLDSLFDDNKDEMSDYIKNVEIFKVVNSQLNSVLHGKLKKGSF